MLRKAMSVLIVLAIAITTFSTSVHAGGDSQPVEWADNPGSYRWSLTYLGRGWSINGDQCDWNDYIYRVNKNASADSDRYRIFSFNSQVAGAFRGKSPIGHALNTSTPYLCLGASSVSDAGGSGNVQSHLIVWVQ